MELILLQKVINLGSLGDTVRVKPGYGRNFLVPQGKAVPATAENRATFQARRADYEAKAKAALGQSQERAEKFARASVTIAAHASAEGKLYGSVCPRDIAEAFTAVGLPLSKREVILGEGPLRLVGEYAVVLHLHADVETSAKVVIEAASH